MSGATIVERSGAETMVTKFVNQKGHKGTEARKKELTPLNEMSSAPKSKFNQTQAHRSSVNSSRLSNKSQSKHTSVHLPKAKKPKDNKKAINRLQIQISPIEQESVAVTTIASPSPFIQLPDPMTISPPPEDTNPHSLDYNQDLSKPVYNFGLKLYNMQNCDYLLQLIGEQNGDVSKMSRNQAETSMDHGYDHTELELLRKLYGESVFEEMVSKMTERTQARR